MQVAGCKWQSAVGEKLQVLTCGGRERAVRVDGRSDHSMDFVTAEARRAELARQHIEAQARRSGRSMRERARLKMLQWRARQLCAWCSGACRSAPALAGHPARSPGGPVLYHAGPPLVAQPVSTGAHRRFGRPMGQGRAGRQPRRRRDPDLALSRLHPPTQGARVGSVSLLQEEAQRLAAGRFDLALILRFDHWWGAWLAAAAGIPSGSATISTRSGHS